MYAGGRGGSEDLPASPETPGNVRLISSLPDGGGVSVAGRGARRGGAQRQRGSQCGGPRLIRECQRPVHTAHQLAWHADHLPQRHVKATEWCVDKRIALYNLISAMKGILRGIQQKRSRE